MEREINAFPVSAVGCMVDVGYGDDFFALRTRIRVRNANANLTHATNDE
jgi:hypothetical protein